MVTGRQVDLKRGREEDLNTWEQLDRLTGRQEKWNTCEQLDRYAWSPPS